MSTLTRKKLHEELAVKRQELLAAKDSLKKAHKKSRETNIAYEKVIVSMKRDKDLLAQQKDSIETLRTVIDPLLGKLPLSQAIRASVSSYLKGEGDRLRDRQWGVSGKQSERDTASNKAFKVHNLVKDLKEQIGTIKKNLW